RTRASEIVRRVPSEGWQDTFPVLDEAGALQGLITSDLLRLLTADADALGWAIAVDVMQAPASVRADDDLRAAAKKMLDHGLREIPVLDDSGRIVGFLDEAETAKAYIGAASKPPAR